MWFCGNRYSIERSGKGRQRQTSHRYGPSLDVFSFDHSGKQENRLQVLVSLAKEKGRAGQNHQKLIY